MPLLQSEDLCLTCSFPLGLCLREKLSVALETVWAMTCAACLSQATCAAAGASALCVRTDKRKSTVLGVGAESLGATCPWAVVQESDMVVAFTRRQGQMAREEGELFKRMRARTCTICRRR